MQDEVKTNVVCLSVSPQNMAQVS